MRPLGSGGSLLLQRACAACETGTTLCAECAAEEEEEFPVQTKLVLDTPGDGFEREAEFVSRTAASQTASAAGAGPASGLDHGADGASSATPSTSVGHESGNAPAAQAGPNATVSRVPAAQATVLEPPDTGSPLSSEVRERVEPLLGADLSGVRVHSGPESQAAASALKARAFTHGSHIWLGPGQRSDDTTLLAHEATHVVQQAAAPSVPQVQRAPADYQHPEDGGNVLGRMQEKIADAGGDPALATRRRPSPPGSSPGAQPPPSSRADPEASRAAGSVDRSELAQERSKVQSAARPDVDRPAAEQPKVQQAAATTGSEAAKPGEPVVGGKSTGAAKGAAAKAAGQAASLADRAFGDAASQTAPAVSAPVQPPPAVPAPLDAAGAPLPADPAADASVAFLAEGAQVLRDEGHRVRARAAEERANAALLRGNLDLARTGIQQSGQAVTRANEHLDYRRGVVTQARAALEVSKEKAETVAQGAPEFGTKADEGKEESGPMASEASGLAAENAANTPDDPEAAANAQEQGGKMEQAGGDIATTDGAIDQTKARATSLGQEAAQAKATNEQTAARIASADQTLGQTAGRLGQMSAQNAAASSQVAGLASGPARILAQANALDETGASLIQQSFQIEEQLHRTQADYSRDMAAVPAAPEVPEGGPAPGGEAVVQRAGYEGREQVDLGAFFRSPDPDAEQRREEAAAAAEERRRQQVDQIQQMAGRPFDQLGAADKVGIALRMTGRNLFGGLSNVSWPGWGGIASGAGHLALGLIDPRGPLEGVVSGLNMTLSGAANLFSARQWQQDPLGNLLKSAADIATGLTIILGSITALAGVIIAIMTAITILSLGTAAPVTGPVIAFCATVMTTVGGWTIAVGKVALILQALVFIKNLIDAACASTAQELAQTSDRMTEDVSNAGNVVMQVGMAKLAQVGGRQMQSAISQAGGGVRFAAQMGARGPLGSAVSGIRSQGLGGYGRQLAGGARQSMRGAGRYLAETSVTKGAQDLRAGAGRLWREMTTHEGPQLTGRQGMSRDFLVGKDVPAGSFRAGSRGVVREELEAAGVVSARPGSAW